MKKYWAFLAVMGCIALSLYLRIIPVYPHVFTEEWIKFTSFDAYWQMSNVDIYAANFPAYASQFFSIPFFQWLLSAVIWMVGWGFPTQQTIDTVAALFPAVLAALTIIPVYYIGKIMFGRMAGIIAALLVAVLPGEWLGRSVLGFIDHHVLETLLTVTVILFLVIAMKNKKSKYAIPGGLILGLYLLTWIGGIFFVFLLFAFSCLVLINNHLRRRVSSDIGYINLVIIGIALIVFQFTGAKYYLIALFILAVTPLLLVVISRYMRRFKRGYFPLTMLAIMLMIIYWVQLLMPELINRLITFVPSGAGEATTLEFQPLFFVGGTFTLNIVWVNYGLLLLVVPFALITLIARAVKTGDYNLLLLALWTLVTLVLATIYRRFGYYFAVNAALLTGWFIWYIKTRFTVKEKIYSVIVSIILIGLVVIPNGRVAYLTAGSAPFAPPDAWMKALEWLKVNSPEDSSVMAWWDYGYWIEREADREAFATPTQQPDALKHTANVFLSKSNNRLEVDYLILDYNSLVDKMWAITTWAGEEPREYGQVCLTAKDGVLSPVQLYYPDYYYTLAARLYNFNGQAIIPHQSIVVGIKGRTITSLDAFATYQEAMAFAEKENLQLVGTHPFISPVPLEKVEGFSLVYFSDEQINGVPQVKIFKVANNGNNMP